MTGARAIRSILFGVHPSVGLMGNFLFLFVVFIIFVFPQAEGSNSDTYLHPVKMYKDPFRGGHNIMVGQIGTRRKQKQNLALRDMKKNKI